MFIYGLDLSSTLNIMYGGTRGGGESVRLHLMQNGMRRVAFEACILCMGVRLEGKG